MTYEEALAFWYGRIDFEKKLPKPGDLKLDRMRTLLRWLGDPQQRIRMVHVAGTKGKGSTSAMLAAVLQAAGYRVGLFTSPHLSDVRERIQVHGQKIEPQELIARIQEVRPIVEQMEQSDRSPTFFEVGTALGFLHFDCHRVDIAVIEVGLGGRFDSTNVCLPMLSVITNISMDHMAQLGNTLDKIAFEKAGIIKKGRPVITTAQAPEALQVIQRVATERRSPLSALGQNFHAKYDAQNRVQVTTSCQRWPWMNLGLLGSHQADNAAGVIAVVEGLRRQGMVISDQAVAHGLAQVHWPARLEICSRSPLTILDCAHNVASMQAVIHTLNSTFPARGKRHLIFAISNDKQVREILEVLAPHFDRFYLTKYANNPRCTPPEQLKEWLRSIRFDAEIQTFNLAADAWQMARSLAQVEDQIIITGSVFLAGEMRKLLVD